MSAARNGNSHAARARDLIEKAQREIGSSGEWKLVSSRTKLGKLLFEVEADGERWIGKVSDSAKAQQASKILEKLWNAGMRPPSAWTVVRPVSYLPAEHLLLQEKAPGTQLLPLLKMRPEDGSRLIEETAQWLTALHALPVQAPAVARDASKLERCRGELETLLPSSRERIGAIASAAIERPNAQDALAPSHGDFHPQNLFFAQDGRVTGIDVDTFGARPRTVDCGYFAAQLRIMHGWENREPVAGWQKIFLRSYSGAAQFQPDKTTIGREMATAFLRSLHYDLCILKTNDMRIVEPLLRYAEESLETAPDA